MHRATVWLMTGLAISLIIIFGVSTPHGFKAAHDVIAQTPLQTKSSAATSTASSATHFVESGAAWGLRDSNAGDRYSISVADYRGNELEAGGFWFGAKPSQPVQSRDSD